MAMKDYEVVLENGVIRGFPDPDYNTLKGLGNYIFEACEKFHNERFLICAHTKKQISFGDFKVKSANLAANLRQLCSIQPGDIIMACMKSSLENSLQIAATLYLNAVTCALHTSFAVSDFKYFISLVEPKVIFVDVEVLPTIKLALKSIGKDARLIVNEEYAIETNDCLHLPELLHSSVDIAAFRPVIIEDGNTMSAIVFSSGTTGMPKGICLSQKSLCFIGHSLFNILGKPKTTTFSGSYYWISGIGTFLAQFHIGTTIITIQKFDINLFCNVLQENKVDGTYVTLANLSDILEYKNTIKSITSLKTIGVGGMQPPKELYNQLITEFPQINFSQAYGSTETGGPCVGFIANYKNNPRNFPESTGVPYAGFELKVIDKNTGKPLGPNENGEVCLRSKYSMMGYYKNTVDVAMDADGFIRMGDMGYYDENRMLYILGRYKEIFKYNHFQIVPAFLENVINEHPAVETAVVFGTPDKVCGCLPSVAIILRKNFVNIEAENIVKFVKERVPDRYRLRGGVYFVREMPRTPSGKIQRMKLYDMVQKLC